MERIIASKQVGDLSYFVGDLATLRQIVVNENIWTSEKPERNYSVTPSKLSKYVSFSRSMTDTPKRNPKRWKYGVIIDGDKLSNRYHIEPYSFAGNALAHGDRYRIKILTKYDTGICTLSLVNWGTIKISEDMFNQLESAILRQSESYNAKKNLTQHSGKNKTKNGVIEVQYKYNTKNGGLHLTDDILGKLSTSFIKHDVLNEKEERIWIDKQAISIKGCIKGIIIPRNISEEFESQLETTFKVCDRWLGQYTVIRY